MLLAKCDRCGETIEGYYYTMNVFRNRMKPINPYYGSDVEGVHLLSSSQTSTKDLSNIHTPFTAPTYCEKCMTEIRDFINKPRGGSNYEKDI